MIPTFNPQPFEIYYAQAPLGPSAYERPWLIIDIRPDNNFGCFPISSTVYDYKHTFELQASHPDFQHTNLSRHCYILCDYIHEIALDKVLRFKGKLRGRLLEAFRILMDI